MFIKVLTKIKLISEEILSIHIERINGIYYKDNLQFCNKGHLFHEPIVLDSNKETFINYIKVSNTNYNINKDYHLKDLNDYLNLVEDFTSSYNCEQIVLEHFLSKIINLFIEQHDCTGIKIRIGQNPCKG